MLFFRRGAKSVAGIDTGGQNPYISTNSQCYHYSSCPQGGSNSIANFDGGDHGRIWPPWIRHCMGIVFLIALLFEVPCSAPDAFVCILYNSCHVFHRGASS